MKGCFYNSDNKKIPSSFAGYHIYQRSIDKSLIFRNSYDAIVLLSILSVKAKKFGIKIYALCFMMNHIHIFVKSRHIDIISSFVQEYSSTFSIIYNKEYERSGSLFSKSYGRAFKYTDKYVRNCISYICNNPVEAKMCRNLEEYVWNFIAFYKSRYPFSKPLVLAKSRNCLRKTVKQVKDIYTSDNYLTYPLLKSLFSSVNKEEALQLKDFIINTYNPLDYEAIVSLFGNIDQAVLAMNSYTGSEHDIKEDDHR